MKLLRFWRFCAPPQNLQNRRVCVLYAKTPKSEVLRPPQKLQNRRVCVVLKILLIIFNTPKSEVLRILRPKPSFECTHCNLITDSAKYDVTTVRPIIHVQFVHIPKDTVYRYISFYIVTQK